MAKKNFWIFEGIAWAIVTGLIYVFIFPFLMDYPLDLCSHNYLLMIPSLLIFGMLYGLFMSWFRNSKYVKKKNG